MSKRVLNASDIKIKIGGQLIAHITDGQFSSSHEARKIFSNDTAPHEEEEPGKITAQLTGNSLFQMGTGFSAKNLLLLHKNRNLVDVSFTTDKTGDFEIVAQGRINDLTLGGATEQNGTISYTIGINGDYDVADIEAGQAAEATMTSFSFAEETGPAIIGSDTVAVEVEFGTDVSELVATFTTSPGATVKIGEVDQVSGTTENDFTEPVMYVVTSEDEEVTKTYTVTVTIGEEEV